MPGFVSSPSNEEDLVHAHNADFSGATDPHEVNGLQSDGELWIGRTTVPPNETHVVVGNITSSSLTVGFSDPDITIETNGGGAPVEKFGMQTGIDPVVPSGTGEVTFNGGVAVAGVTPVTTFGSAATTMELLVQLTQANNTSDPTKVGLALFDSAAFDVDASGFVQLNGGGIAATSFDVQANTAPGTDPVVPTAAGVVTVNGAVVAAHSVPLETRSRAANAYNVEVQYAAAVAATDGTKSGVAHFDSADFAVDASGFVTLTASGSGVETLTPDSGGAQSPTGGTINVLGRSGSKTVGTTNTVTVHSPPYADQAGSTTVTLNSGSFATNAITLTTPASAGLIDGDLIEFVATNGVLVIQLAATQVAHMGTSVTSVAGTITGSATGDSISMRYQASTNDWWTTSAVGVFVLA